jgi:preprotein translocase subunit YajC
LFPLYPARGFTPRAKYKQSNLSIQGLKMAITDTVLDFFITSAHAADAGAAEAPKGIAGFSPLLIMLVFLVFIYLTVWRPQNKRAKEQRDLLNSLAEGDEVVTIGGIIGKIAKMTTVYVVLATSDTAQMTVQKSAISTVLPKGTMKSI